MESNGPPAIAKRLWHMFRIIYYMLRKGISKGKLMMDLHLLLKRGKLAGKAIGNLVAFNHHNHHHHHHRHDAAASGVGGMYSAFTCRSMDPNSSYYNPREVEFSCSNTPAYYASFHATKRKHHRSRQDFSASYDPVTVAKVFEILNEVSDTESVVASPSPAPLWAYGRSPAPVRQLRITDSPFPIREEGEADGKVDMEAEEFIKRFYEQLRHQTLTATATPEYRNRRRY